MCWQPRLDLLPRGMLPPGGEVAAQIPVELPSSKSAVVPKNRSRSTATRCSRNSTVGRRDVGRPGCHWWRRPGGETAPAAARGCGFNRQVTPGEDGFGHFAVALLTRPRSHPLGTTSCSRAIGRAAAKSPLKEWLDLFGGDGGIDEMLARAPVTGMFGTAISVMKRRKRGCCRGGSERPQLDCGLVRPFAS